MQQELIICKQCNTEYGPTEAIHVIRFTCDHCGKQYDTKDHNVPIMWSSMWSSVQEANMLQFILCTNCTIEFRRFINRYQTQNQHSME